LLEKRISLLGRLRKGSTPTGRAFREDVIENLRELLRTRLGSSPSASGYGLPDMTDLIRSTEDVAVVVARSLKLAIEAFEPRLVNVRVTHAPGESWDQQFKFEVTAQLANDKSRSPIRFETRIDPSHQVSVR